MGKPKRSVINGKPVTKRIPLPAGGVRIETFIPWTLVKRGVRREVITPIGAPAEFRKEMRRETQQRKQEEHSPLLRSLGLAHYWQHLLDDGKFGSITEIAAAEGMDVGRAGRILRVALLSPEMINASLAETTNTLALEQIVRRALPLAWRLQRFSKNIRLRR